MISSRFAHALVATAWLAAGIGLAGCVPIPYRPGAEVVPAPAAAEEPADFTLSTADGRWLATVAASIRREEARVLRVDGATFLGAACADGSATLSNLLTRDDRARQEWPADYLLLVGRPGNEQLDDRGVAVPWPVIPVFIVGYERRRSVERVEAVLVAVHGEHPARRFAVESRYSEVAAGMAYGFATIAMPESAVKLGLAREVARLLRAAQPSGPIRLAIVEATPRHPT